MITRHNCILLVQITHPNQHVKPLEVSERFVSFIIICISTSEMAARGLASLDTINSLI